LILPTFFVDDLFPAIRSADEKGISSPPFWDVKDKVNGLKKLYRQATKIASSKMKSASNHMI